MLMFCFVFCSAALLRVLCRVLSNVPREGTPPLTQKHPGGREGPPDAGAAEGVRRRRGERALTERPAWPARAYRSARRGRTEFAPLGCNNEKTQKTHTHTHKESGALQPVFFFR